MKPRNFPSRRRCRQLGIKRQNRAPHIADIRFRIGKHERLESGTLTKYGEGEEIAAEVQNGV